jgi:hypothetical protein
MGETKVNAPGIRGGPGLWKVEQSWQAKLLVSVLSAHFG